MTRQQKLARVFLFIVCFLFALLLVTFSFAPGLYHVALFGHSITLGIPIAFAFMSSIFVLMTYYVLRQNRED